MGCFPRDGHNGLGADKSRFITNALAAHSVYVPEVRHPTEVAAVDQAHLNKWPSKRPGTKVKAPVVAKEGYQLVVIRLLPGEKVPAVQFMYENDGGKRLTFYVSPTLQTKKYQFPLL